MSFIEIKITINRKKKDIVIDVPKKTSALMVVVSAITDYRKHYGKYPEKIIMSQHFYTKIELELFVPYYPNVSLLGCQVTIDNDATEDVVLK